MYQKPEKYYNLMRFPIDFNMYIGNNKNLKQSEDYVNCMIFIINDIGTSINSAIKLTHQIKPLTKQFKL